MNQRALIYHFRVTFVPVAVNLDFELNMSKRGIRSIEFQLKLVKLTLCIIYFYLQERIKYSSWIYRIISIMHFFIFTRRDTLIFFEYANECIAVTEAGHKGNIIQNMRICG